ncbi:hypothetical protein GUA87_14080 [Sneathiella sp. P13V-1]|uniref:DUF4164 family protein n=1 Tax=Sneathiella sp. P13V-1 TaxID=2697366 RepID=UPI00187B4746|nr:DUF4164 family protein [Sneathiella sp. P13V-1]MBE7637981.1 hypothetical protein [Sneathiella sp. P13V-1]
MGNQEEIESRIIAAIERIERFSEKPQEMPQQASFIMGDDPAIKDELETLRSENQLLRQELLELTAAYNGLKQAATNVSGKLDDTIEKVSELLEH